MLNTKQSDSIDFDLLAKFKQIHEDKGPLKFKHGDYRHAIKHHLEETEYHEKQAAQLARQSDNTSEWHKTLAQKHVEVVNALQELMKHQDKD